MSTSRLKSKFFSLYLGQFVLKSALIKEEFQKACPVGKLGLDANNNQYSYLELKHPSEITDLQALELCIKASPLSFEDPNLNWKIERDMEVGFLTVKCKKSWHSFTFSFETGRVFMYDGDELSNNYLDHYGCYLHLIGEGFYLGDGKEIEYGWVKLSSYESSKEKEKE